MSASSEWPPTGVVPCSANDKASFAYESVAKRWPVILTDIINACVENKTGDSEHERQGSKIINGIQELKYSIAHDKPLEPLTRDPHGNIDIYNAELHKAQAAGAATWFKGAWLYEECYLYRKLHSLFLSQPLWRSFDPFAKSKTGGFKSAGHAVHALAKSLQELVEAKQNDDKVRHAAFLNLVQAELWGNASGDLSLFAGLSDADIEALQRNDAGDRSHRIIDNDLAAAWDHLSSLQGARIDIVLDNAGFELFTDLVFADWLVTCTPYCQQVVFHAKAMPWFVSDVLLTDFAGIFGQLDDPDFFTSPATSAADRAALAEVVKRWRMHILNGKFGLVEPSPFWTGPSGYAAMPSEAPALLKDLRTAGLVVFKGDLNYRKLTGDLTWPHDTPFDVALGPLRGQLNLLALRTCKADVVVGLETGKGEELDKEDPRWRWNGKYGIVAFSKKD